MKQVTLQEKQGMKWEVSGKNELFQKSYLRNLQMEMSIERLGGR